VYAYVESIDRINVELALKRCALVSLSTGLGSLVGIMSRHTYLALVGILGFVHVPLAFSLLCERAMNKCTQLQSSYVEANKYGPDTKKEIILNI
jgi:hypothetical protein